METAIQYAVQITSGLAAAHELGFVHRDLKPSNVMIGGTGIKLLDFGLVKPAAPGSDQATRVTLSKTQPGQVLGTPSYTSPEQAEGKTVDARSDVFSFGIVLYQMLCGQLPFAGDTTISTIAAVLHATPKPPRSHRSSITRQLERIVLRCLQKSPGARYASARELHRELEACRVARSSSKWRLAAGASIATLLILAASVGIWSYVRTSRSSWVENEAVPEITQLMDSDHLFSALMLYRKAEGYKPDSAKLLGLSDGLVSSAVSIETTPPGANIYILDLADNRSADPSRWHFLGQSPMRADLPVWGRYRVRAVKETLDPAEIAFAGTSVKLSLQPSQTAASGMIWVNPAAAAEQSMGPAPAVDLAGFWLDKYEVTNREFKQFVEAGGYQKPEYWKHPFSRNGKTLSWDLAMNDFRDATGRPGPATWELGSYHDGTADLPVSGVSWYEAAAYAQFVGKKLPTVYHWYQAAGVRFVSRTLLQEGNFDGRGLARGGRGRSRFGAYDMAGNVKEWAANRLEGRRYVLGGAWNQPSYALFQADLADPFDRSETNGFRCMLETAPTVEALLWPVRFYTDQARTDKQIDDATFRIYAGLNTYDKTELNAIIGSVDDSSPHMRVETVAFDAAYADERVTVHLFLPKNARPPYQVVVYFGTFDALIQKSVKTLRDPFQFVIRSGRAMLIPAFKGALERSLPTQQVRVLTDGTLTPGSPPHLQRELLLAWPKDLSRSIDYLETRADIDTAKLAYYGVSYGAMHAPRLIALEPRVKAAVLHTAGTTLPMAPEVDPWNYVPRVTMPVLMVNGRNDELFPVETRQRPLFRALGTPEKDKRHILVDGGHANVITQPRLMKEILDWFDRYLGPVAGEMRSPAPVSDQSVGRLQPVPPRG